MNSKKKNLTEIKLEIKILQNKLFDVLTKMKQCKWKLEFAQK